MADAPLVAAGRRALVALGESDLELRVVDAEPGDAGPAGEFGARFPARYTRCEAADPALVPTAARLAAGGATVFLSVAAEPGVGPAYSTLRRSVAGPGANVKLFATHASLSTDPAGDRYPMFEDIGLMRGVPGMTVVVPADAPTCEAAVRGVAARSGPAYVRVARGMLPPVNEGAFQIGRAAVLRDGGDLAVVAVGAMVGRGLELAAELAKVGVSTRVLDLASVKPFDQPALLRAARDTGAVLVAEEHSVATGVGSLVASVTAENYPVPVRRVGFPDVFAAPEAAPGPGGPSPLSLARMTEDAWELLRLRGKVE